MGNTGLRNKSQEFLELYKNSCLYPSYVSYITRFVEYCETADKKVKDFVVDDFGGFLNQFTNPFTLSNVKGIISRFLKYCNYSDAEAELRKFQVPKFQELSYILSFKDLKARIDDTRSKQYEELNITPITPPTCDNLTLGEVVLYLAWLGVPRDMIARLPLSAINLEKKCVEYDDSGIRRTFSFSDYPAIEEVFANYKNAQGFLSFRNKDEKVSSINNGYYGSNVIRSNKPSQNGSNAVVNVKTTLSRIFSAFEFARDYKNVYFSGAFARGYEKIMQGNLPEFTSEGVMDFFGITAETQDTQFSLKQLWKPYLVWRLKVEGEKFNISPDDIKMMMMKSIAVKCISSLNSFPEDDNAKIKMTVGELEDLMLAICNLGKADLK